MRTVLFSLLLLLQAPSRPSVLPGVVSGRLFDSNGAPAAGRRVAAMAAPDANSLSRTSILVGLTQTDSAGRYQLGDLPPGRYYITAGAVDFPTYYPGVQDMATAPVITVTAGASITGLDFAAPAPPAGLTTRSISGGLSFSAVLPAIQPGAPALPPVKVSGRLTGFQDAPAAAPSRMAFLPIRVAGGPVETALGPDGSFQLSLAPGAYIASAFSTLSVPAPDIVLNVPSTDLTGIELAQPRIRRFVVRATVDGGGAPLPSFGLRIGGTIASGKPTGQTAPDRVFKSQQTQFIGGSIDVQPAPDGTFPIVIPEGEYRLGVGLDQSASSSWFEVKSITNGGVDLLVAPFRADTTTDLEIRIVFVRMWVVPVR